MSCFPEPTPPQPLNLPPEVYLHRPALLRALTQAQLQPERPDFTPTEADRLNDLLAPLMLAVPGTTLSSEERRRLGGATYLESAALAWHTGRALIRQVEAFPGAAPVGESLQFRGMRAITLRGVAGVLTTLARHLEDLALLDLASATRDATRIHEAAVADAEPPGSADNRLPLCQLARSRRLLAPHRTRMRRR